MGAVKEEKGGSPRRRPSVWSHQLQRRRSRGGTAAGGSSKVRFTQFQEKEVFLWLYLIFLVASRSPSSAFSTALSTASPLRCWYSSAPWVSLSERGVRNEQAGQAAAMPVAPITHPTRQL